MEPASVYTWPYSAKLSASSIGLLRRGTWPGRKYCGVQVKSSLSGWWCTVFFLPSFLSISFCICFNSLLFPEMH